MTRPKRPALTDLNCRVLCPLSDSSAENLLRPGENCWKACRADRFGWAVDGAEYFRALRESFENAEHEILIVGWDIDSRVQLVREEDDPLFPSPLCETLQNLVDRKPDLRVFVLSWDFAMVYVLERELLPAYSFGWEDSERLHFHLDGKHAAGASQHQKIVVVDGQVGFVGGIDITKARWDRRGHPAEDPGRQDPNDDIYGPFHDVQAAVDGQAAAALRELVSARWENATGSPLPPLEADPSSLESRWPDSLKVQLSEAEGGLARTWVDPQSLEVTREVESLYKDLIASANRSIYIENQYFTSGLIADALAERLREKNGPEIVIVLPHRTSGWLEQSTMDVLRNRALETLTRADEHGRLRIVSPVGDDLGEATINVHAKLIVVDDDWLRIGSANLSRRSMGLDSECDLLVDSRGRDAARRFRSELLAEHLGADAGEIAEATEADGLLGALDRFNGGERWLDLLSPARDDWDPLLEPLAEFADMEKPIERSWRESVDRIGNEFSNLELPVGQPGSGSDQGPDKKESAPENDEGDDGGDDDNATPGSGWLFLGIFVAVLGFWVYWLVQGAGADLSLQDVLALLREQTAHPLAPLLFVLAMVAGSLLVAPIIGMVALCGLLFEPYVASLTAIAGTLAATAVNHRIGRHFADAIAGRIPDKVAGRIDRVARSSDALTLAGLRLIPIAPFSIINLAVGAVGIRLRPFLAGTLIGMGPGILLICFSVDRARAALQGEAIFDPWIAAVIALAGIGLIALRVLRNRQGG